jgi:hypothetical protein
MPGVVNLLNESLGVAHRASQDDEWEGYSIPAGALILVKVLVNGLILCGQEAPCKFTLGTGSTL